jgi:NADH-quinone oxidoreductase subunit G
MRRRQKKGFMKIASIGPTVDYYMGVRDIGSGGSEVIKMLEGRLDICKQIIEAEKPIIMLGVNVLSEVTNRVIEEGMKERVKRKGWRGMNYSYIGSNSVGQKDVGIRKNRSGRKGKEGIVYYIIDGDEMEIDKGKEDIVIYQGHHGDKIADIADIILPSTVSIEKEGLIMNSEGRVQQSRYVINPGGQVRIDWQIVRALQEVLLEDRLKNYESLKGVRNRMEEITAVEINGINVGMEEPRRRNKGKIERVVYNDVVHNYYRTNSVARASEIMAECTRKEKKINYKMVE